MRNVFFIIILCFSSYAYSDECKGHIFFVYLEKSLKDPEIEADYSFYYGKTKQWLNDEGYSYSVHTKLPVKSKTCFKKEHEVTNNQLPNSLGYIFVKPNRKSKVISGVLTDVDIDNEINLFFK